MARKFVTDKNIQDQIRVITKFCEVKGFKYSPYPGGDFAPIDFKLYDKDGLYALVEVKCRYNMTINTFPDIKLSYNNKWSNGVALSKKAGVPLILMFGFDDGSIYWIAIDPENPPDYNVDGGWSRNDIREGAVNDKEPMIAIPVEDFEKV